MDPLGRKGEFFFPDLGSFTTNVNVYAEPGSTVQDQSDLQSMGATRVFKSQWIHIDGKGMPLMRGDFKGIPGRWIMEQATFVDQGKVWHLTVSYDVKYGSMRPMMVRMLKSFHAHP